MQLKVRDIGSIRILPMQVNLAKSNFLPIFIAITIWLLINLLIMIIN